MEKQVQRNRGLELIELINSAERCNVDLDDKLYFYLLSKLYPESTAVDGLASIFPTFMEMIGGVGMEGDNDDENTD